MKMTMTFAAAAPERRDDDMPDAAQSAEQQDLDELCERWVRWKASRRMFAPPPKIGSVLGQLSGTRTRPLKPEGPDAICSAELAAFHLAYTCQPDALDKRVFDLYYVYRVAPIKTAADALGISRKHFYSVLGDFRLRVHKAAQAIVSDEQVRLADMQHKRTARAAPRE